MSHFITAVFTKSGDYSELKGVLQPFHEFECTGTNDQYVVDQDVTEEAWESYMSKKASVLRHEDGTVVSSYDNRFYREPTEEEKESGHGMSGLCGTGSNGKISWTSQDWGDGKGYRAKVRYVPEGWTEDEIPQSETESFVEFVKGWYGIEGVITETCKPDYDDDHKYGYIVVGSNPERQNVLKVAKRTNPNRKWDWWVIGGRWQGRLLHMDGSKQDSLQVKDWNWKGDLLVQVAENSARYNRLETIIDGREFKTWEQLCAENENIDEVREIYHAQPVVIDIRKDDDFIWDGTDMLNKGREAWINSYSSASVIPFSFVDLEGNWNEKGRMGWWGIVANESEQQDWNASFLKYLESLDENTYITCVDCHI